MIVFSQEEEGLGRIVGKQCQTDHSNCSINDHALIAEDSACILYGGGDAFLGACRVNCGCRDGNADSGDASNGLPETF